MSRRPFNSPSIDRLATTGATWPTLLGNAIALMTLIAVIVAHSGSYETAVTTNSTRASAIIRSHPGSMITSLSWSVDGRYLATAGLDLDVELRDPKSGRLVRTLVATREERMDSQRVLREQVVAFSPDGRTLAVGDTDGNVVLLNVDNWGEKSSHFLGPSIRMMAWAPDGRTLAIGSRDGELLLWDVETDRVSRLTGSRRQLSIVAFSPDGGKLATGGTDGYVRLWDRATGSELWSQHSHTGGIGRVGFSTDGSTLFTCSTSERTKAWHVASGVGKIAPGDSSLGCTVLACSADGRSLATASREGLVLLMDLTEGREVSRLSGHGGAVTALEWSPDGRMLASSCFDSTVRLWNVEQINSKSAARRFSRG